MKSSIYIENVLSSQAGRYDCVGFSRLDSITSRPSYLTVHGILI